MSPLPRPRPLSHSSEGTQKGQTSWSYDVNEELESVAKIMWIPCMETSEPVGEGSKDLWKAEWIYTRKMEKEA